MLQAATLGLLVVLGFGFSLIRLRLKSKPVPSSLRWAHGLSALLFFGILFSRALRSGMPVRIVTCLFLVTLLGGIFLLWTHLWKRPFPLIVALVHGVLGFVAFILLLAALGA